MIFFLTRLKEVFVASNGPSTAVQSKVNVTENEEHRLLKITLKQSSLFNVDMSSIPKGKISVLEALTVLNNYKCSPNTWTAEKIATDYDLDSNNTQALLEYFIPFDVKIIAPEDKKQIKET
ncbi:hypothetical protein GDO86_009789 [Hymenochirus boettgeri]|uniref:NADH dehydrogenase [ubiquinone] 1 alpha subcomplex assembly factor 4 n=1 Tax=Hymenochirus boettgeri TaxID=247094 RepID=A0A8T2JM03_9PIPI|nr:hypothetical protein GDO86_009789 [Hymenochirus boettgeri]